ncbi:hypothetical protein CFC21_097189 [Triticum aestivum]|uniref:Zinc finger GRF-type domain-containing protein n=2 Tax=Triticum aestivum TaxID=4565 RepID=A0A9R1MZ98_WHEAT|nr:hypothetical protein CFC21_097189 [Triticum aestivum]
MSSPGISSNLSSASAMPGEVNGVGIVEHASEFYLPEDTCTGLEYCSKHHCTGHGLVPARQVAWGGGSTGRQFLGCPLDLPEECHWLVWVDPPPPTRVALAFENMHAEIERMWIKSHQLQKRNLELAKKRTLKKKLKERDEMLRVWILLFGITLLCVVVVAISVSSQI